MQWVYKLWSVPLFPLLLISSNPASATQNAVKRMHPSKDSNSSSNPILATLSRLVNFKSRNIVKSTGMPYQTSRIHIQGKDAIDTIDMACIADSAFSPDKLISTPALKILDNYINSSTPVGRAFAVVL